ncbi:type I-E CRISPR-associated protein Cse2/CasB [Paludibacterium yongneupense]|uniref:type I-E CRISPR-associated protein Cse2/CasB n=1 Tax=Paludibacterium yongneupense TaxID=400061 RepID=UPI0003FF2949|nr:type I-E CRISPR-associated protein Cse2/CasB [Paludibacterium yongneupense]
MFDQPQAFVLHLQNLAQNNRGALAALRRSAGFAPGAYPPAFPYVERFVSADSHAEDSYRQALYVTAALFSRHPQHAEGQSLAAALGKLMQARDSGSIEQRFIALLAADAEDLSQYLRQIVSLLAADGYGLDYVSLLQDLSRYLNPFQFEARDKVRQRWARDFYRQLVAQEK